MKIKILFLLSLMVSSSAMAGHLINNGGNALICSTAATTTIEALDYFEARTHHGLELAQPEAAGSDELAIANELIMRLRDLSPRRVDRLQAELKQFYARTKVLRGQKLNSSNDSLPIALPVGCYVEQVITQMAPEFSYPKHKFYLNGDLWDRMDVVQRAGLIVHELLLSEAVLVGHTTSHYVRFLVGQIASYAIAAMTAEDFSRLLLELRLPVFEAYGAEFYLYEPKDADCSSATATRRWDFDRPLMPTFFEDGRLSSAVLACGLSLNHRGRSVNVDPWLANRRVEFYRSGRVAAAHAADIELVSAGPRRLAVGPGLLRWHANGSLAAGLLAQSGFTQLTNSRQDVLFCAENAWLTFDDTGALTEWAPHKICAATIDDISVWPARTL